MITQTDIPQPATNHKLYPIPQNSNLFIWTYSVTKRNTQGKCAILLASMAAAVSPAAKHFFYTASDRFTSYYIYISKLLQVAIFTLPYYGSDHRRG
jgi:hypothetical protein